MHPRQVVARHRQHPVARPGGQDEVIVGQGAAIAQAHLPGGPVDRRSGNAGSPGDAVLVEVGGGPQAQAGRIGLAREVGLRQGRPLVGQALVAQERDGIGEARLAQGGRDLEAGLAGADDDDTGRAHASNSAVTGEGFGDSRSWGSQRPPSLAM